MEGRRAYTADDGGTTPTSFSSSAIRFLGLFKQPDPDPTDPFELDESEVIWSTTSGPSDPPSNAVFSSPAQSTAPIRSSGVRRTFHPQKSGLSAALKNPSPISAASVARPISRKGTVDSSGLGSGRFLRSAPVQVPAWRKGPENLGFCYDEDDDRGEEEEEEEEEMFPPHEMVARSQKATFSVFEGFGRTLKGRDLSRVRNAVWQKTGFLDSR